LNSEISEGGSQASWLKDDLAAHDTTQFKVVQYHKALRSHYLGKSEGDPFAIPRGLKMWEHIGGPTVRIPRLEPAATDEILLAPRSTWKYRDAPSAPQLCRNTTDVERDRSRCRAGRNCSPIYFDAACGVGEGWCQRCAGYSVGHSNTVAVNALIERLTQGSSTQGSSTQGELHDRNCGFKCYRRDVVKALPMYGEMHRMVPSLASIEGFMTSEIPVEHHARQHGVSKYGVKRFIRGFMDMWSVYFLKNFRERPQHLMGGAAVGLGVCVIGLWAPSPALSIFPLLLRWRVQ
jgi:hypothetical protein